MVSLIDLEAREVLGVVGESGCGKSVHALSIMRLIPDPARGRSRAGGAVSMAATCSNSAWTEMRHVRGRQIAMVFQDPMTSLNPVYTVGFQIMEALMLHQGLEQSRGPCPRRRTAGTGGHPGRPTAPG